LHNFPLLRSRLQVSTSLCRSLHQRQTPSHVPYQPTATAAPNDDSIPPLPPIDGTDFTFPASPGVHSACAALPWLLRVLNVIQLLIRTKALRVFLISIACSSTDDDVSDLAAATSAVCSTTGWTLVCCTINTAAIGDLVSSIRWIAIAHRSATAAYLEPLLSPVHNNPLSASYGSLVISSRNCREESILALRADALCNTSLSPASSVHDQTPTTPPRPLTPVVPSPRPSPAQPCAAPLCSPAMPHAASPCPLVPAAPVAHPPQPPPAPPLAAPHRSPAPFARPLIIARLRCKVPDPPCFVFRPDHPMPELLDEDAAAASLFGHSFGLPFTDSLGILQTRQLSWPELLPAYNSSLASLMPAATPSLSVISDLRRYLPPITCQVICAEFLSAPLQAPFTPTSATSNVARCLTTAAKPLPSPATWTNAYANNPATASLFSHLSADLTWSPTIIAGLHPAFQQFARDDNLCLHHGRLVVRQSLQSGHSLL
jgi:hypothetical protein